jgi:hypothetical protein
VLGFFAYPYPLIIYYPECTVRALRFERGQEPGRYGKNRLLVLHCQAKDDDPRVGAGWVSSNVRKIGVEGDETTVFRDTNSRHIWVTGASYALVNDGKRVVTAGIQHARNFNGQILVNLETHDSLRQAEK